jgi:hypothetical protein
VIPTTIEEGEADGVAAALAQRRRLSFVTLADSPPAIAALQNDLRSDGAILDYAMPATIASTGRPPKQRGGW